MYLNMLCYTSKQGRYFLNRAATQATTQKQNTEQSKEHTPKRYIKTGKEHQKKIY
jgi:hypothetical protein